MSNSEPTFVNFAIARQEPNIMILRFPEQIIFLNLITQQAFICPACIFYQAVFDEFQLGD